MKNFKKLLALVLSALMVISCLSGMMIASAEEAADPNAPKNVEEVKLFNGNNVGPHGKYTANQSVGVKITVPEGKRVVKIAFSNLAFYANGDNKIKIEVFKWKGDYASSVNGKVLAGKEVGDHPNNTTYAFELPNELSVDGEVLFRLTYISGPDGMTPWKAEGAADGVTFYANGNEAAPYFVAAYYADELENVVEEEEDPNAPQNVESVKLWSGDGGGATGYFGLDTSVATKVTVPAGKRVISFTVENLATYADSVNKIQIKAFLWNTDYKTTVAGEAIASQTFVDHQDNQNCVFDLPLNVSAEGEVLFVAEYLEGKTGLTPWNATGGVEGVTYYQNGSECDPFRVSASYADALPDLKCYAEIDYTKYMEDPVSYYGFDAANQADYVAPADKGYVTFISSGNDAYFAYRGEGFTKQADAVTCDKMDFIVIKYRTSDITRGEFYTGRTDGVGWANPMGSSHIDWGNDTSGEWAMKIIDASGVWGNVEGVHLTSFRYDFGGNCPGSIDVSYIRFYATYEGALACVESEKVNVTETVTVAVDDAAITKDADGNAFYGEKKIPLTYVPAEGETAECYTYNVEKTVVKAPEIPFNPADMDLRYVYDGLDLAPSNVGNAQPAVYDFEKGCVTYVATGDDPQVNLAAAGVKVGPYMAIKYRTVNITTSDAMECFIGEGPNPTGATDNIQWSFIGDGQWHTKIIYIGDLADYNKETDTINHFRFDFLRGAQTSADESIEVEYIAFFGDEASAEYYTENDVHELPKPPTHTVTFVADGIEIVILEFMEGDTELKGIPEVPAKEGYTGVWESYTLGKTDIVVNAVYTEAEAPTEVPTETPTDPVDDPTEAPTDPVEDPTEVPTETPTEGTDDTDPPAKKGCKSVIGMGAVAVLAVAAAVVTLKKKED